MKVDAVWLLIAFYAGWIVARLWSMHVARKCYYEHADKWTPAQRLAAIEVWQRVID